MREDSITNAPPTVHAPSRLASRVFSLTLLLWVPAVFAAYYAVHKPIPSNLSLDTWALLSQPGIGTPLIGALLDLAAAAWLTAAATGTGLLLLKAVLFVSWFRGSGAQPASRACHSEGAGAGRGGGGGLKNLEGEGRGSPLSVLAHLAFAAALGLGAFSLAHLALGVLGLLAPVPAFFFLGLFTGVALLGARNPSTHYPLSLPQHDNQDRAAGSVTRRNAGSGGGGTTPPPDAVLRPSKDASGACPEARRVSMTPSTPAAPFPVTHGDPPRRLGLLHAAYCLLLTAIALLTLTQSLTPPTAWDALVYHLTGPKRSIEAGQILGGLDIPHLYFPSLVEQLFTAGMLIRGEVVAQLMHFALAVIAVLAVFAFLDQRHGRRAAWLGAALLASVPSLASLARVPYVEWGVIAFGFLAFWALQEALERDSRRWLLLSGCLAGLAMGTKYTAAFLLLGTALPLVVRLVRASLQSSPPLRGRVTTQSSPPLRGRVREGGDLILWGAAAGVVASPWFLRNLALTGNPVYPFFFGGWNWDSWKAEWFSRTGTGLIVEPWRLLIAPWDLTVMSVQGGGAYDVDLGPLFLALAPLLLIRRPDARWARHALIVVGTAYASWLIGAGSSSLLLQGRLLLPILPFLACLLAASLSGGGVEGSSPPLRGRIREGGSPAASLTFGRVKLQPILQASVLLTLTLSVLAHTIRWVADPPLPYLLRKESREAYLERHLGEHYRALASLPAEGNTLFLWEPRSYLCRAACQPDALLYNWRYLLHRHGTSDQAAAAMRRDGYTHVLLSGGGLRYFAEGPRPEVEPGHIQALQELEARHLDRLYGPALADMLQAPLETVAGRAYAVYRLK